MTSVHSAKPSDVGIFEPGETILWLGEPMDGALYDRFEAGVWGALNPGCLLGLIVIGIFWAVARGLMADFATNARAELDEEGDVFLSLSLSSSSFELNPFIFLFKCCVYCL